MHFVYEITCVLDEKKYVGKSVNPARRFLSHLREAGNNRRGPTLKKSWIQSRGAENMRLNVVAGPFENAEDAFLEEIKLISHYRSAGIELTNDPNTSGGENPPSHLGKKRSPETIEKMKAAIKIAMNKPEIKIKYATSHVGKKMSPESVEKMRKSLTGKKHTEQARRNMGNSHIGKKHSKEWIEAARKARWGK